MLVAPAGAVVMVVKVFPSTDTRMLYPLAVLGAAVESSHVNSTDVPERAVAFTLVGSNGAEPAGGVRPYTTSPAAVPTKTSPLATVGTANLTTAPTLSAPSAFCPLFHNSVANVEASYAWISFAVLSGIQTIPLEVPLAEIDG